MGEKDHLNYIDTIFTALSSMLGFCTEINKYTFYCTHKVQCIYVQGLKCNEASLIEGLLCCYDNAV